VTTRNLSHKWFKSVQGFDLGIVARKKYNQDRTGQDRTTKKSQKRTISHICGIAPRKDIAIKFGTEVDVLEVVTLLRYLLLKFFFFIFIIRIPYYHK